VPRRRRRAGQARTIGLSRGERAGRLGTVTVIGGHIVMTDAVGLSPFGAVGISERHEVYGCLARTGPVHRITLPSGTPSWLVTGHAQVRAALNDARLVKAPPAGPALLQRIRPDLYRAMSSHMLLRDGAAHARLRGLVGAAFTRRRIEALAPRIQQITDDLLDVLDTTTPTDLVAGFAYPLPMTVICEMIGVPERDRDEFRRQFVVMSKGPPFVGDAEYVAAVETVVTLVRRLVADRRAQPGADLLSGLVVAREGGDTLSDDELTSMVQLLVFAGHETTVNLLANGIHALLTHPDQMARLRGEPGLVEAAVEELLRFESPVQAALPLRAVEPLEIDGVGIAAGETVVAALLAANRDPSRTPRPDSLDIGRVHNPHLAFGYGVHHCLGAPLARLEGRIALTSFLGRFPRARLAVGPEELAYHPSVVFHGLAALPVLLT